MRDGSLSKDCRHIEITLKEREVLLELARRAGLKNNVTGKKGGTGSRTYRIQISDKSFYDFLISVGLMPDKSSRLGKLLIPKRCFQDFLRGVIDGDGSIRKWTHPSNGTEQWSPKVYSGFEGFVEWLREEIERLTGAKGRVHINLGKNAGNRVYVLKFGKLAAKEILRRCYTKDSFAVERKARMARECLSSNTRWTRRVTVGNLPG